MKAIVIGRHAGDIPGVEIVELRPVTFPLTADECEAVIRTLWKEANGKDAGLIFQNLPGQVGVALARMMRKNPPLFSVGVVISVPGKRLAGVNLEADFQEDDVENISELVKFGNPNAKVQIFRNNGTALLVVTVDPPMRFVFSHIEWL